MISIKLDRDDAETGEFLTGRVYWSAESDRRARRIIVSVSWETVGEGNRVHGVARAMEHVPKGAEETFPFRFLIPHEGPVTFKAQLTGIVWKVRVRADQPGFDEFAERVFRVEPRRERAAAS